MKPIEHGPKGDAELVGHYYEGDLSPEDAKAFEEHLAGCAVCRDLLDAMKLIGPAVDEALVPPPMSAEKHAALLAKLREQDAKAGGPWAKKLNRKPLWRRGWFIMLELAVGLVVALLLVRASAPPRTPMPDIPWVYDRLDAGSLPKELSSPHAPRSDPKGP